MSVLLLPLPEGQPFATRLSTVLAADMAEIEWRRFPDSETYLRLITRCDGRATAVVGSLDQPDSRLLRVLFLADAARDLGATSVGLIAPYLGYLRQDRRFKPGEAITSRTVGRVLSSSIDWLVTLDPHLHRYHSLSEIYGVPAYVAHAAPAIATWIATHVAEPLILGPDEESAQWVESVAAQVGAPWTTLRKTRHGDRSVDVSMPDVEAYRGRTPVLLDDIISSARTMVRSVQRLRDAGLAAPYCIGVHALLDEALRMPGAPHRAGRGAGWPAHPAGPRRIA